jgi:hypothetical protein
MVYFYIDFVKAVLSDQLVVPGEYTYVKIEWSRSKHNVTKKSAIPGRICLIRENFWADDEDKITVQIFRERRRCFRNYSSVPVPFSAKHAKVGTSYIEFSKVKDYEEKDIASVNFTTRIEENGQEKEVIVGELFFKMKERDPSRENDIVTNLMRLKPSLDPNFDKCCSNCLVRDVKVGNNCIAKNNSLCPATAPWRDAPRCPGRIQRKNNSNFFVCLIILFSSFTPVYCSSENTYTDVQTLNIKCSNIEHDVQNNTYTDVQTFFKNYWYMLAYPIFYLILVVSENILMNLTEVEWENFEEGVLKNWIKLVRGSGNLLHAAIIVWKCFLMALGAVYLDDQFDKINLANWIVAIIWGSIELFIGDIFPLLILIIAKSCAIEKSTLAYTSFFIFGLFFFFHYGFPISS